MCRKEWKVRRKIRSKRKRTRELEEKVEKGKRREE